MAKLIQKAYNVTRGDVMPIHVLVHHNEDGYWAEAPGFGCFTQGNSLREVQARMPEAVELMLEGTPLEGAEFRLSFELLPFEVIDA
jgi:predicted RNase H-like HicB family nuclease